MSESHYTPFNTTEAATKYAAWLTREGIADAAVVRDADEPEIVTVSFTIEDEYLSIVFYGDGRVCFYEEAAGLLDEGEFTTESDALLFALECSEL